MTDKQIADRTAALQRYADSRNAAPVTIVKDEYAQRIRPGEYATYGEAGRLLTMSDGSVWFHPYNGRPPVREN